MPEPTETTVEPTPTDPAPIEPKATAPAEPKPEPAQEPKDTTDWKAKYEETLGHSRKHEGRAKDTKAQLDKVLDALGLSTDGKPDPDKLAADLAAASNASKAKDIEIAVLRAASTAGANPNALTDSRSFMDKVGKLDPTSDTFAKDVDKAIKAAIDANPALRTTPAAPSSGNPVTGGNSNGQLSRDDLKTMSPHEINKAREDGRLNDLLGIK